MTKWTEEHPDPPQTKPSDWYWFIFEGETELAIIEVYHERKYWPNGLWGPMVQGRPENPLKIETKKLKIKQTEQVEEKLRKRKRGRPKKKKD